MSVYFHKSDPEHLILSTMMIIMIVIMSYNTHASLIGI